MLVVKKLKESYEGAIKEHLISVMLFFLSMVCWSVTVGDQLYKNHVQLDEVFTIGTELLAGLAVGVLLCEAIHNYKKQECEGYVVTSAKSVLINALIMAVSVATTVSCIVMTEFLCDDYKYKDLWDAFEEISRNLIICYVVTYLGLTIFFFYKRSKENTEVYVAKAFCGLMKAELVYGIIALGVVLIIAVFNTLIYDTYKLDLMERIEIILLGLVEYPCILIGLSKTEAQITKFGKAVLSYVFTALLAIAFVIIYIYIFKIIATMKLPSNEVFSILTWLFVFGVFIWTMAQGACDENLQKLFKAFPFFFLPFIVLQFLCLYIRIDNYGFTQSRYLGVVLILFEVVYFGLYSNRIINNKDIMAGVIFILIAASVLILFFPGTNMYSVVTRSQKKSIEKVLALGRDSSSQDLAKAYIAYDAIVDEGGIAGARYIKNNLSDDLIDRMKKASGNTNKDTHKDVYLRRSIDHLDVYGYTDVYYVDISFEGNELQTMADIHAFPIYPLSEDVDLGTVNIASLLTTLAVNDESGADSANQDILSQKIAITGGGVLYITEIHFGYDSEVQDSYKYIRIEGYVLK